jgi:hypothetical protein
LDNNERIGIEKKDERNQEKISPPTKQELERCFRK